MNLKKRLPVVKGIIFDLADTITEIRQEHSALTRSIAEEMGLDLSNVEQEQMDQAITDAGAWLAEHQIQNNLQPSWGSQPEEWLEADRKFWTAIGFPDLSDEVIIEMTRRWNVRVNRPDFECITDDAKFTLRILRERGYLLGIATRRNSVPDGKLQEWEIDDVISTLQYSGVAGYEKPSPYTLLKCAEELGLNPRTIAFVGNSVNLDVQAALRAEMVPILTVWSNQGEAELAPDNCIVINEIGDLLDLFLGPL
jgi:phosphoglycolate phosphatase-like HAD superfamily hydrolase